MDLFFCCPTEECSPLAKWITTAIQSNRKLEYGADQLIMNMTGNSHIEKIIGTGNAKVDNTTADARTHSQADKVELQFDIEDNESVLRSGVASG